MCPLISNILGALFCIILVLVILFIVFFFIAFIIGEIRDDQKETEDIRKTLDFDSRLNLFLMSTEAFKNWFSYNHMEYSTEEEALEDWKDQNKLNPYIHGEVDDDNL